MKNRLKPCPDCSNPVSPDAAACPKCGKRLQKGWNIFVLIFVILALLILPFVYFALIALDAMLTQ